MQHSIWFDLAYQFWQSLLWLQLSVKSVSSVWNSACMLYWSITKWTTFRPLILTLHSAANLTRRSLVQVNLFQELSFLIQLTHNMTRDCSLNSLKNTSSQHVVYKYCFECQNKNKKNQFLSTTCCELVFFGEF